MKQIRSLILIFSAALILGISCGSDDSSTPNSPTPNETNQPSTPTIKSPTIDESSITCDVTNKTLSFHAERPAGTKIQVLFCQQTNGTEEKLLDVTYYAANQQCSVSLVDLVPGSTYTFYIIGYDSQGKEVFKSEEGTFTLPKAAPPAAPSTYGIKAFAPSSLHGTDGYLEGDVITLDLEYSTDGGETWTSVSEAGVIKNLASGIVLLRIIETPTREAGQVAKVTVPEYPSNTDVDGQGGNSEGLRVKHE